MFKTFPEFSKLNLNDRVAYEAFTKEHPPIGDLNFAGLMTWWNPMGDMSISTLNDNLVIPYWLPGDENHSGLSLVGINKVDESLCTIFDHQKDKGEKPRLVNVPEFVIASVQYPEMFIFKEERKRNEYIFSGSQFYPLKNMGRYRRRKVERALRAIGEENILTKSLDLHSVEHQNMLLKAATEWQGKNINNYGKLEEEVIRVSIANATALNIECACLFVRGHLYGFCLYVIPSDKRYIIVHCIKATNEDTLGFELMAYAFTKWFTDKGAIYGNLNSDYGLLRLRMFLLSLGPQNFFRKYIVEPV